jgi:hypothetical protein
LKTVTRKQFLWATNIDHKNLKHFEHSDDLNMFICKYFDFTIFQQKLKKNRKKNCAENSKTESVEHPIKSKLVKLCTLSLGNRKK